MTKQTKKTYTPDQYSRQAGWLTIIALILMAIVLFSNGLGPALMLLCLFVLGVAAGTMATKAAQARAELKRVSNALYEASQAWLAKNQQPSRSAQLWRDWNEDKPQ